MKKLYLVFTIALFALFSYNAQAQGCEDCLAPRVCTTIGYIQIPDCGWVYARICYSCDENDIIDAEILEINADIWNDECDMNSDIVWDAIYEYIIENHNVLCGYKPCNEGGKTIRITKLACMLLTNTVVWDTPTEWHNVVSYTRDINACGDKRYTCCYWVCWDEATQKVRSTFSTWYVTGSGECVKIVPGSPGYPLDQNWSVCTSTWTGCPKSI